MQEAMVSGPSSGPLRWFGVVKRLLRGASLMRPIHLNGVWSAAACPWAVVVLVGGLLAAGFGVGGGSLGRADDADSVVEQQADGDPGDSEEAESEGGIGFPSDRLRERQ